jgi:hypothetical protein
MINRLLSASTCVAAFGQVSSAQAATVTIDSSARTITGDDNDASTFYGTPFTAVTSGRVTTFFVRGDLSIASGDTINGVGANAISIFVGNNAVIGNGVSFNVSASAAAPGPGGGGGGAGVGGVSGGVGGVGVRGAGGRGGTAGITNGITAGGAGDRGSSAGNNGASGSVGGATPGGAGANASNGGSAGGGGGGGGAGRLGGFDNLGGAGGAGGDSGAAPDDGSPGGNGSNASAADSGAGGAGGSGGNGGGGTNAATSDLTGGGGGGSGRAGGAGGGGSSGRSGGGGGGGGGSGAESFANTANGAVGGKGGDGAAGGNGGNGGKGGSSGGGGNGGGAIEIAALGRLDVGGATFLASGTDGFAAPTAPADQPTLGTAGSAGKTDPSPGNGGGDGNRADGGPGGNGANGAAGASGGAGGAGGAGGGGAGGTAKLFASVVIGSGTVFAPGGIGGGGIFGGNGGSNGRLVLGSNTSDGFTPSLNNATVSTYSGSRRANPFVQGAPAVPFLPDLPGGAEIYGLTTLTPADFPSVVANAPDFSDVALYRVHVGPSGYDTDFSGFDLLFYINLSGAPVDLPVLGAGGSATAGLLQGGFARDTRFGGGGPAPLAQLAPGAVWVTPIPATVSDVAFGYTRDGRLQSTDSAALPNGLANGNALYITGFVPPSLSIGGVTLDEGNAGQTNAVFTVRLPAPTQRDVIVQYATEDGTALAGSDYTATSGTLSIPAGRASGTISVPIRGDLLNESNETFFLNLSNAQNAVIASGQATGVIRNDDAPPAISISNLTVSESATGATLTVSLSAPSGQIVSVDYATANGTALAPGDYASASGTVTFAPGVTSRTIAVTPLNDGQTEGSESFFVNLSNAQNATLADTQGVVTISDDDLPTLGLSLSPSIIGEAGGVSASVATVTRTGSTAQALQVLVSLSDGSEVVAVPSVTIPAGQSSATFALDAVDDDLADGVQIVTVSASAPGLTGASATVTVLDDDGPTLRLSPASSTLSEAGGATTFTVSRNTPSDSVLTIVLQSSDPTSVAVPGTVTIGAGQRTATFVARGIDNLLADGTRAVTITASAPRFNTAAASLSVSDDEAGVLSLSISPSTIPEDGGLAMGTLQRNTSTATALLVQVQSSDTSEASVPQQVVLPAGAQSVTFLISGVRDRKVDGSQTATITVSAPGLLPASAAVVVTDSDSALPPRDVTPPLVRLAGEPVWSVRRLIPARGSAVDFYALPGQGAVVSSGLKSIAVQLQRGDGFYFNGRTFQRAAFNLRARLIDRSFFTLLDALPGVFPNGRYRWTAIATDNAGLVGRAQQSMIVDATAPSLLVVSPAAAPGGVARVQKLASVAGRVSEASKVEVALRNSSGAYFNGRAFQRVAFFLTAAQSDGTWLLQLPRTLALAPGRYTIMVRANDAAGNVGTAQREVEVVSTPSR